MAEERNYHSMSEKQFAEYLVSIGYPRDSIIYEPAFLSAENESRHRPDFLIVDPRTKERLAIIEVKRSPFFQPHQVLDRLKAYSAALGARRIPVFLVAEDASNPGPPFELWMIDQEGNSRKADFSLFPTFPALLSEEIADRKAELRREKENAVDEFKRTCWILAALLLLLVAADFIVQRWNIRILTTERMTLLGFSIALIVLPYAQKFKGLGIEFEKAQGREK